MLLTQDYLSNVNINVNINGDLKSILMNKLNEKLEGLDVESKIEEHFDNYSGSSKWVKCVNECKKGLKPFIDAETISTAYMLRLLAGSVVKVDETKELVFEYIGNLQEVTGVWREDGEKFTMTINEDSKLRRLIMGFGPSASGKTYWTKELIKMISDKDSNFPKIFLSIDGGIAREKSAVYQKIIEVLKNNYPNIDGFKNLVSTIGRESLFDSNKIKKEINTYLRTYARIPISLYVPTTASGPSNPYSKYVEMTQDDKWIGVYIWQHETNCPKDDAYKCETTRKAGKEREIEEGKKFSSKAYFLSEKNGRRFMQRAPGGRIDIHNSGSQERGSIITEYGINNKFLLTPKIVSSNSQLHLYKRENDKTGDVSIIATFHIERYGGTRKRKKNKYSRKYRRTRKKG